MLKLDQLKPYLTSSGDVLATTKTWQQLYLEIDRDGVQGQKSRSPLAIEASLLQVISAVDCKLDPGAADLQHPHKVLAACKALHDLCPVSEQWQPLLTLIAEQLLPAVYSDYYASAGTQALEFHQLPYFQVVRHMEAAHQEVQAIKDGQVRRESEHKEEVQKLQVQIAELQEQLQIEQETVAAMKSEMSSAGEEGAKAQLEVQIVRAELRKARRDLTQARDELTALKLQTDSIKRHAQKTRELSELHIKELKQELLKKNCELDAAAAAMQKRVSPVEFEQLQHKFKLLAGRLNDKEAELAALSQKLTPRPYWAALKCPPTTGTSCEAGAITGEQLKVSTRRMVEELLKKVKLLEGRAQLVDLAQEQLDLALALAQPDPPPYRLHIHVTQQDGQQFAEGLGVEPQVPRCLRWQERMQIAPLSPKQLLSVIWHMLDTKLDPNNPHHWDKPLMSFMYQYLRSQYSGHKELAAAGYRIVAAVQQHAPSFPLISLFGRVLSGELPLSTIHAMCNMLKALSGLLRAMASPGQDWLQTCQPTVGDVVDLLSAFYPALSLKQRHKLSDALHSSLAQHNLQHPDIAVLADHIWDDQMHSQHGSQTTGAAAPAQCPSTAVAQVLRGNVVAIFEGAVETHMHRIDQDLKGALESEVDAEGTLSLEQVQHAICRTFPYINQDAAALMIARTNDICSWTALQAVRQPAHEAVMRFRNLGVMGTLLLYDYKAARAWVETWRARAGAASSHLHIPAALPSQPDLA